MTEQTRDPSGLHDPLTKGTRVLSMIDGEPGTIRSAVTFDAIRGWTEYEVVVGPLLEVWKRDGFVLITEIEVAD